MFLRACVRVFRLETWSMKNFADVKADVKKTGVHQPLKARNKNVWYANAIN